MSKDNYGTDLGHTCSMCAPSPQRTLDAAAEVLTIASVLNGEQHFTVDEAIDAANRLARRALDAEKALARSAYQHFSESPKLSVTDKNENPDSSDCCSGFVTQEGRDIHQAIEHEPNTEPGNPGHVNTAVRDSAERCEKPDCYALDYGFKLGKHHHGGWPDPTSAK